MSSSVRGIVNDEVSNSFWRFNRWMKVGGYGIGNELRYLTALGRRKREVQSTTSQSVSGNNET